MAIRVLKEVIVSVNGVALTDHATSATVNYSAEEVESTNFGGSGFRDRVGGLKDWSADFGVQHDEAASSVNATLFPLVGERVPISIKPSNAAVSATNPAYEGTGLITSFNPVEGEIGALSATTLNVVGCGPLVRRTS